MHARSCPARAVNLVFNRMHKGALARTMPSPPRAPSSAPLNASNASNAATETLIIVGDVHNKWSDLLDRAALHVLAPSAVLFVGDLGNQDVALTSTIASLAPAFNLVTILGNHDAWYCLTDRGRKRAVKNALHSSNLAQFSSMGDANAYTSNQIYEMLEVLGDSHVGYGARRFANGSDIRFVGARPFSKGGVQWSAVKAFYEKYYGVSSMEESAERILGVILGGGEDQDQDHSECFASVDSPLVVLAHNGPAGLGSTKYAPCGVDFMEPEDDFGDPDLEEALETAWVSCGTRAALVTFGHMHSRLKYGGLRNMVWVDGRTGTVYLNAAVVPRVETVEGGTRRHFVRVEMVDGVVVRAENVWVRVKDEEEENDDDDDNDDNDREISATVDEVECILEKIHDSPPRYRVFRAHTNDWIQVDVDL